MTYSYTYDKNGNILTASDGTYLTTYTYDSANQLTREDNQQEGKTYTWTYDAGGNITAYKTYAYSPDVADLSKAQPTRAVPYVYSTAEWKDLLASYNGKTIEYDTIGNPSHIGDRSFTWKHGRQLATLTENNTTWSYTYNNAGLRTGRYVEDGTSYKYVYNGSQLMQMTVNGQKVTFTYDAAGTPLTMKVYTVTADPNDASKTVTTCDTYYYVTNLQGDVMGLMDSTGNLVVSYEYSAYGVMTVTTGATTTAATLNPLTYRGYVYDAETGLYYLQSRYYDPEIGRFINADALVATGQGFVGNNMFAYCGNNPVLYCDPCGTCIHNFSLRYNCDECQAYLDCIKDFISDQWDKITTPIVRRVDDTRKQINLMLGEFGQKLEKVYEQLSSYIKQKQDEVYALFYDLWLQINNYQGTLEFNLDASEFGDVLFNAGLLVVDILATAGIITLTKEATIVLICINAASVIKDFITDIFD